jgi:hypothetical protein
MHYFFKIKTSIKNVFKHGFNKKRENLAVTKMVFVVDKLPENP